MAVNACPNDIGVIKLNITDDAAIANAIAGRISTITNADFIACIGSKPLNAFISLPIPNDITVNIPAINIAVIACPNDIGVTIFNIQDDKVIAIAIAGRINIITNEVFIVCTGSIPSNAFTNLPIPKEITVNIPAINMVVNACPNDIGVIKLNIKEDAVTANAIITITYDVFTACFIGIFISAIFSNAIDTKTIANESPTTDKKSILPINLKASPMARTPTAINRIVETPFFRLLSDFSSPPTSSITLLFLSFFLDISSIVC